MSCKTEKGNAMLVNFSTVAELEIVIVIISWQSDMTTQYVSVGGIFPVNKCRQQRKSKSKSKKTLFKVGQCKQTTLALTWRVLVADKYTCDQYNRKHIIKPQCKR